MNMYKAGVDLGKAVALFILGAAALMVVALLLAVPQGTRKPFCDDTFDEGACEVTIEDYALGLALAGGIGVASIGFAVVTLGSACSALKTAWNEEPSKAPGWSRATDE